VIDVDTLFCPSDGAVVNDSIIFLETTGISIRYELQYVCLLKERTYIIFRRYLVVKSFKFRNMERGPLAKMTENYIRTD
jgi:hypothetical protein